MKVEEGPEKYLLQIDTMSAMGEHLCKWMATLLGASRERRCSASPGGLSQMCRDSAPQDNLSSKASHHPPFLFSLAPSRGMHLQTQGVRSAGHVW